MQNINIAMKEGYDKPETVSFENVMNTQEANAKIIGHCLRVNGLPRPNLASEPDKSIWNLDSGCQLVLIGSSMTDLCVVHTCEMGSMQVLNPKSQKPVIVAAHS